MRQAHGSIIFSRYSQAITDAAHALWANTEAIGLLERPCVFEAWYRQLSVNFSDTYQCILYHCHIDGLEQDCSNSIANTLELRQSCTKPSIYYVMCDNVFLSEAYGYACNWWFFISLCIIFSFLLCSTENAENESMAWRQPVLNESNPCFDKLSRHTSYFKRWWIRKRMIVSYDPQILLKFYWPVNFQDSCKTSRLIDFEKPDGCNCWIEGP